ncbi:MAG TPA: RNA polymerase sigma factor [Polyangiales bacterium]|nr:RNA polymerase sigma factor [Polyangiales bacterium]
MSLAQSDPGEPFQLSDEALIERIRLGDGDCFALLMQRYNQRLYRVARAITRHDADAEDAVQHAYLSAFTHLYQFAGLASFSTWLTRIVINQALSRQREQRRLQRMSAELTAPDWRSGAGEQRSPEDQVGCGELRGLLEAAIDALPEDYRAIVVLREVEGLSTQEAAACLSISEETARVRLHRARGLLRTELGQRAGAGVEVFRFGGERCARMTARVLAALHCAKAS